MPKDTAKETARPDIAALSFEQAMAELETIVSQLEKGEIDLDAAISTYERGIGLKRHCERKLREAQLRVEKIEAEAGGAVGAQPFEAE